MDIAPSLSKAYEYEDTLQFLGETVACYNEMLHNDLRLKRSTQAHKSDDIDKQKNQQPRGKEFFIREKPVAFQHWLMSQLGDKRADSMDGRELITLKQQQACSFPSKNECKNSLNLAEVAVPVNPSDFDCAFGFNDFLLKARENRFPTLSDSSSGIDTTSVCTNYDSSTCSSSSVRPGSYYDYATYENCSEKCYASCPSKENELKDRPGSWSDSGYSFTKSESDYSRFSSLSFGEKGPSTYVASGFCYEDVVTPDEEVCETEIYAEKLSRDLSQLCVHGNDSLEFLKDYDETLMDNTVYMFEDENYNAEEKKILEEIANNPDNKHETTKALSDICRNVPSKTYRLTSKKLKRSFKLLCKKISGSVKKNSPEKERSDHSIVSQKKSFLEESQNCSKPLKNPFKMFSFKSLRESKRGAKFLPFRTSSKNIQRASSYSSLFGRKGSLFTSTQSSNIPFRRSVSLCSLEYNLDLARNEFLVGKTNQDEQTFLSCRSYNKQYSETNTSFSRLDFMKYSTDQSEYNDVSIHQSNYNKTACDRYGSCHKDIVLAPLQVNVTEQRSAHRRQVRKLSNIM